MKCCIGGKSKSKSTLLLYSTDLSSDNLISIQLDSITLNEIITDSEKQGRIVKKINFRNLKNIDELFNGKSTKFSFIDDAANSQCDISCTATCKPISNLNSKPSLPPRPFIQKKGTATGPPYLPPVSIANKDEGITIPTTKQSTTTTTRSIISTTTTRAPISITKETIKPISTTRLVTTTTRRPTTTLAIAVTRSKSTPGPSYLPLARKSTTRRSTVTGGSTYPPATWPSVSKVYTETFPTWSAPIRLVTYEPKSTTTTVRYEYKEPSNSLIYTRGELE